MNAESQLSLRKIMKLKTVCVGGAFQGADLKAAGSRFPANVLSQTDDFEFRSVTDIGQALSVVRADKDIDLVFLDPEDQPLVSTAMFVTQLREQRPRLPIIIFTDHVDDTMRYLLRSGATWHYLKTARVLRYLSDDINSHIFLPVRWEDMFAFYARDDVKPRIEPGLGVDDLAALHKNPEEQYIIKRLFANSDVVQIFRMDEGFSGSRIYTVKPRHQLKRILKIGTIDELEAVSEKQETMIQPRLFRQVGQIRGQVIGAQHLAGACYSLAGSKQDAITLSQFLQNPNQVRKEVLDKILLQLRDSLQELYSGSAESELRYWAPLYSRILPPTLSIKDAAWAAVDEADAQFVVDAAELTSVSSIPNNRILSAIEASVREGDEPEILLKGFEIAEINAEAGVVYLHDNLVEQYSAEPLLQSKEHPLLRFKVSLRPEQRELLSHPVFRQGKKIAVRGRVADTSNTLLARHIGGVTGQEYDFEKPSLQLASADFLSPLDNIRFLLWEVGREDMIVPAPLLSPVIHGDLNGGNVLIEADSEATIWLIDFSDARSGHIYFDIAKLEVEFRTHVFYRLFKEMVSEKLWDESTTTKFLLLIENLLLRHVGTSFDAFASSLRDCQSSWYEDLHTQFPLYFENLLYFLYSLRHLARSVSVERFDRHYPVAMFFQSIAALKYEILDEEPWQPWARRLVLCSALVNGKEAIAQSKRPNDITRFLGRLRQRSALALITIGHGENRRYLMQWNKNWGRFNLVGGRISNEQGDRDSFARTMQRKMREELGLRSPKDYQIVRERQPVIQQQFSRRQFVFREYEFRVFEVQFLPRHPRNEEEFNRFVQRLSSEHENLLLSPAEINQLRTYDGRPVSETARTVLNVLGEIEAQDPADGASKLAFHLDELRPLVTRGRAQITGSLVNSGFGKLIENILVEILPRPGYAVEPKSTVFHIQQLDAGYDFPLEIGVQPIEQDVKLTMRVTYYDTRGHEYQQLIEHLIQFRTPVFSLFELDNPYLPGKPLNAGSETMFIGREDVFARLGSSLLHGERAHSVVLIGPPRIGKTSLLLQLVNGSLGRIIRSHAKGFFLPIYINLKDLQVRHTGHFFAGLSQIMTRMLRNRGIVVPPPDFWPEGNQGFALFDKYLDQVEGSLPDDGRLILILDDLPHLRLLIDERWVSDESLAYLRSLMLHRSRIALVLSGTGCLLDDYWRLLVNAGEVKKIGLLSRKQSEQLIREPVQPQIHYDDLVVDRIWRMSGGHPYLLQLICHRLISGASSGNKKATEVNLADLEGVVDALLDEDDAFLLALWENSSPMEKLALAAAASVMHEADIPVRWSEIRARLAVAHEDFLSDRHDELDRLVARELMLHIPNTLDHPPMGNRSQSAVESEMQDSFMFAFDLLRLWLIHNHPFDEVLSSVFQHRAIASPK